mgnify:CR=1 FL=1
MKEIKQKLYEMKPFEGLLNYKEIGMDEAVMMGHLNAKYLFIAIQPSHPNIIEEKNKNYNDVVYNSPIGKRFYQLFLEKTKLKYDDIYITNLIKHPHPNNAEPTIVMADYYFDILLEQVNILKNLKYIILLGKFVEDYIKVHPLNTKAIIISIKHPSYYWRIGNNESFVDELVNKIKHSEIGFEEIDLIQTKYSDIYEFYRDKDNIKKYRKIEVNNYFYIKEEDLEKVLNLIKSNIFRNNNYPYISPKTEWGFKSIYNEKLIKIIPNKFEFWKIKKILRENKIKTFEYDIDVYLKYLISNKIIFSKIRKIGIIDIENYKSLDVDNTPDLITGITLYNYEDDKYYTWILENPLKQTPEKRIKINEILYFFKNEKNLLLDFANKYNNFDFDLCLGWNCENFDFAYLINRLIKLNINPNLLSKWCDIVDMKVECSKIIYGNNNIFYRIFIPGQEIIDMILPMKKCNCYSEMPASFSLASTCNWYLKDERKFIEIGPDSWINDINLFIKYNIHDVYLVKKLVDEYKLLDFIYIIQTEIAGVPLKHVTHNSIVLLYYLKQTFPDIILPDNLGIYKIEEDEIDLGEFYLKLKAATVLDTPIGIFDNVLIFDFAALYTTIFITFNICPSTINLENGVEIDDIIIWKMKGSEISKEYNLKYKYLQNNIGIYPQLLRGLLEKRNFYKNKMKEVKKKESESSINYRVWLYRSDVVKQILNSLFGVGGYSKFNIYNPIVSASVTAIGRELIECIGEYCKSLGLNLCAADTDSLLLQNALNLNEYELEKKLNDKLKDYIFNKYPTLNKNNY